MQVGAIEFGEIDAKNEVFKQKRTGSAIFRTSFREPPGISIYKLLQGENFFIFGQKGCGKTALLLYLQEIAADRGWATETILFRSGISEQERQNILSGQGFSVMMLKDTNSVVYDFLFNWLWLTYSEILRQIEPSWLISGREILEDLKNLIKVNSETRVKALSEFTVRKIAVKARVALNIPYVSVNLKADVEAIRHLPPEKLPLEIIQIVERYISQIKLKPNHRVLIFFDELELFLNKIDQRERDLSLIRDLLQAVSRTNQNLNELGASVIVYASVRSEVLEEVNQLSPEIARDVEDFGVEVNWNVKATADKQPILDIVESKINASEREAYGFQSSDVWQQYFPDQIYGRNAEEHLLDVSMFKPRFIIMRLNLAKDYDPEATDFSFESFEETNTRFSSLAWREVSEQLLHLFTNRQVNNLKQILTGWRVMFRLDDFEFRVLSLNQQQPGVNDGFKSREDINRVFQVLYSTGAVGNRYRLEGQKANWRDRWHFRGYSDPALDKDFVIHESLRKFFQLSHD